MNNMINKTTFLIMLMPVYNHMYAMQDCYPVESKSFTWEDQTRLDTETKELRNVTIKIWYPVQDNPEDDTNQILQCPVIVLIHQNKILDGNYSAMAETIACRKFVVMTITNHNPKEFLKDIEFMLKEAIKKAETPGCEAFKKLSTCCDFKNIGIIFASSHEIKAMPRFFGTDRIKSLVFLSDNDFKQPILYCSKNQTTKDVTEFLNINLSPSKDVS